MTSIWFLSRNITPVCVANIYQRTLLVSSFSREGWKRIRNSTLQTSVITRCFFSHSRFFICFKSPFKIKRQNNENWVCFDSCSRSDLFSPVVNRSSSFGYQDHWWIKSSLKQEKQMHPFVCLLCLKTEDSLKINVMWPRSFYSRDCAFDLGYW